MAQLFCDVVIKNTGSERGNHFWAAVETNLLTSLVLYVDLCYLKEKRNIGEVYKLLTLSSEKGLNALFDVLPTTHHPAKAPYAIFKQSSDTVRRGVIIGLGSRIQVFQNKTICDMTAYDEIDMELKESPKSQEKPGAAEKQVAQQPTVRKKIKSKIVAADKNSIFE